jgi:hypothetical protein
VDGRDDTTARKEHWRFSGWLSVVAPLVLIALGFLHEVVPKRLTLDWQSVVLVLAGVVLLFIPLRDFLTLVNTLKVGGVEIGLNEDAEKLARQVTIAEIQEGLDTGMQQPKFVGRSRTLDSTTRDLGRTKGPPVMTDSVPTPDSKVTSASFSSQIMKLMSVDPEMALVRLGTELERALSALEGNTGTDRPKSGIIWSKTLRHLVASGMLSAPIAAALTQFRNVRNEIIHSSREGAISRVAVASAVASGLELLRLLQSKLPQRGD